MLNIGPQELLIILVIALVVVGPQRLPALGRSIGRGLREMRRAQDEVKRTIAVTLDDDEAGDGAGRPSTAERPRSQAAHRPSSAAAERLEPPRAETGPKGQERATRVGRDPTPSASEPLPAEELREVTRTLGRSLAELRRAREEVQRSFQVDLGGSRAAPRRPANDPQPPERPEPPAQPAAGDDG